MKNDEHPKKYCKSLKKQKFKQRHPMISWAIVATLITIVLSSIFSFLAETIFINTSIIMSAIIALIFVVLNVLTDTLGVSVTACNNVPFLAMASRKIYGAKQAVILIKNADKISNICSDIIGDICGIMSGAVGANIVGQILLINTVSLNSVFASVLISTIISALTVFLKAIGKYVAMRYYKEIVLFAGKIIALFQKIFKTKK